MSSALVESRVRNALEGLPLEVQAETDNRLTVKIEASKLQDTAIKLKQIGFDHVKSVTGTEYPSEKRVDVTYHISSYDDQELAKLILSLKTSADASDPRLASLTNVWASAEYHERETFDLVGVIFEGHPQLERLLLPDDWDSQPPLLKSFKIKTEGIEI